MIIISSCVGYKTIKAAKLTLYCFNTYNLFIFLLFDESLCDVAFFSADSDEVDAIVEVAQIDRSVEVLFAVNHNADNIVDVDFADVFVSIDVEIVVSWVRIDLESVSIFF